jgi:hypothetical protein
MDDCRKECRGCGSLLPLASFPADKRRRDGVTASCRSCLRKMRRVRREVARIVAIGAERMLARQEGLPVPPDS